VYLYVIKKVNMCVCDIKLKRHHCTY